LNAGLSAASVSELNRILPAVKASTVEEFSRMPILSLPKANV